MKPTIKLLLIALIITAIAACGGPKDKYSKIVPNNGTLTIPLTDVNDGNTHYYTVNAGGKDIKFFLVKSNDGVIRAAFDACDVCFPEKKGYRQEGDFVVCNNCGQKFHSSRINVIKGGCNPSPLARKNVGDSVIISMKDVTTGARYF
ncbi:MAG: DUF2318 domain-containing protein [Denitrovibrio sp.]|nr:MAG: DUF2318 domain-containing protein [Denitrovibrio sp.]